MREMVDALAGETCVIKNVCNGGNEMTREQAKQNLIAIGVAEPTDEQISNYLNQVNGEAKKEKDRADKYKAEADKVAELQGQLDNLNNQNLTDLEKLQKQVEQLASENAKKDADIASMKMTTALASIGIVGDNAKSLFNEDGGLNVESLGKIIADREQKSVAEHEKKLLDGTGEPGGSNQPKEKTEIDKVVELMTGGNTEGAKTPSDIVSAYK